MHVGRDDSQQRHNLPLSRLISRRGMGKRESGSLIHSSISSVQAANAPEIAAQKKLKHWPQYPSHARRHAKNAIRDNQKSGERREVVNPPSSIFSQYQPRRDHAAYGEHARRARDEAGRHVSLSFSLFPESARIGVRGASCRY